MLVWRPQALLCCLDNDGSQLCLFHRPNEESEEDEEAKLDEKIIKLQAEDDKANKKWVRWNASWEIIALFWIDA